MSTPITSFYYTAPYGTVSFECYGTYDSYQSSLLEYCINLSDMENVKKLFHHCQLTNQTITIVESTPFEDKVCNLSNFKFLCRCYKISHLEKIQ